MAPESPTDTAEQVADPSLTGAFVRGRRPLGRAASLPRIDRQGERVDVVRPQMPRYRQQEERDSPLGRVMVAEDVDLGRQVWIRQLRPSEVTPASLLRFTETLRTVGCLDHPGAPPLHDVGVDETGLPFAIYRPLEGQSLRALIVALQRGDPEAHARWPFRRRVRAFEGVLRTVAEAHRRGIVHRDLRPETLFVTEDGRLLVLGWELARGPESHDLAGLDGTDPLQARIWRAQDHTGFGEPRYLAPEQADGMPASPATDIYALGVVLHEWLTLRHYLADLSDLDAILEGVRTREPPPPAEVEAAVQGRTPVEISWMVLGALAKDPGERYPSASAWLERMAVMEDGVFPVRCPISFQKRALAEIERWMDRYPAQWTVGAAAVVVFFLAAGMGMLALAFALGALVL